MERLTLNWGLSPAEVETKRLSFISDVRLLLAGDPKISDADLPSAVASFVKAAGMDDPKHVDLRTIEDNVHE